MMTLEKHGNSSSNYVFLVLVSKWTKNQPTPSNIWFLSSVGEQQSALNCSAGRHEFATRVDTVMFALILVRCYDRC